MIDKQVNALRCIIEDSEIRNYAGDAFWSLIQAVTTADTFAGITAATDIKKIIFHMPTLIFWDKMKRYLLGTFRSYEDQTKMSSKFNKDYSKYNAFVKQQIQIVNKLDDDQKVDFYASLTRCFLLSEFESELYFKLAKVISDLTCSELLFLQGISYDYISEASNPVPTPLLGHRCRSSQEITGSPTPFSTSNHYLWICESASFSLSNPNIAA